VQDPRRRKIVEKFMGELREALSNTAYDKNMLSVSVRRRKSDSAPGDDTPPSNRAVTVDIRI
jgi:hypothetical protein